MTLTVGTSQQIMNPVLISWELICFTLNVIHITKSSIVNVKFINWFLKYQRYKLKYPRRHLLFSIFSTLYGLRNSESKVGTYIHFFTLTKSKQPIKMLIVQYSIIDVAPTTFRLSVSSKFCSNVIKFYSFTINLINNLFDRHVITTSIVSAKAFNFIFYSLNEMAKCIYKTK